MILLRIQRIASALIALCAVVPAFSQSVGDARLRDSIPTAWAYESQYLTTLPSDDAWWRGFDDPVLTALISRGEDNSFDLAMTRRRIEMARQNWELARSAYYPTIGITAGWNRDRSSAYTAAAIGQAVTTSYMSLGLNFSWEIDIFGRVAAQSKESKAAYTATKAEYQAAMISLSANIATAYFNLRLVQGRIEIARAQIESQTKMKVIAEARHEAGLASKLDVAQALTVLYTTEATLPQLENMERSALNSIALLVGCYPDELKTSLAAGPQLPNPFRVVNLGVPADLLRRRPDIAQAEAELAGYAAAVGVDKKDFLPTLTLTGSVGTMEHNPKDLFKSKSFTYSIAPQLSWTIFEGMARNRRVAAAKEQMLAGIDNYNLVVMQAVIEADDAMSGYDSALRQIALDKKVLQESRELFTLAVDRYKRGLSAFTDVMNAQVTLLESENSYLQTKASALTALVKVYAAVAGTPESQATSK